MWIPYNPNPVGRFVGDCAVRAVAKALDVDWETAYALISVNGFLMGDVISSDSVWGAVLQEHGFYRTAISSDLPNNYTVAEMPPFLFGSDAAEQKQAPPATDICAGYKRGLF